MVHHVRTEAVAMTGAGASPADDEDVRLSLPARPENVAVIRHVLAAFAETLGLPDRLVEDLRLAVTEACTNVVRHAYGGRPGTIDISIRPEGDRLRVVVADHGRGMGPSPDTAGPGLGLPLIAALAETVDFERAADAGSRVAMTFARRPEIA
jgi:anti-sigma regulatory factor (Ser/Thr protein kinase)